MSRDSIAVADYHVHPDFSYDAKGSIEEYCQAGLSKGLSEICFTTHYDFNPDMPSDDTKIRIDGKLVVNSAEKMQIYINACAEAHQKYYPYGMAVKSGVEASYFPGCEKELKALFDQCYFHYKLGSIHEVGEYCICYENSMKKCAEELPLEQFADKYFGLMHNLVNSGLFDSVAHLDLYRLHGIKFYGEDILKIYEGRVESLLEEMRDNDIGFEINTKAVRKGLPQYYPTMDIVNIARKIGTRVIAIGSDAHCPEEVAADFEMASALAYDLYPYVDE